MKNEDSHLFTNAQMRCLISWRGSEFLTRYLDFKHGMGTSGAPPRRLAAVTPLMDREGGARSRLQFGPRGSWFFLSFARPGSGRPDEDVSPVQGNSWGKR